MAIPTPTVSPGNTNIAAPVLINRELCMGDSLAFINGNTDYFNILTYSLQLSANNSLTLLNTLSSNVGSIPTSYTVEALIIGGGGGASGTNASDAGGGAGAVVKSVFAVQPGNSINVTVGSGGSANSNGTFSSFNGVFAMGGGAGTYLGENNPGASGGGTYALNTSGQLAGSTGLQGYNGGTISGGYHYSQGSGGGGSAGAAAAVNTNTAGAGGAATSIYSNWASATSTGVGGAYAGGGGGRNVSTYGAGGGGGAGGGSAGTVNAIANTGSGGGASAGVGGSGVVIIRYTGSQKGSGGTITSNGGYTYHTFTTVGSNTYIS